MIRVVLADPIPFGLEFVGALRDKIRGKYPFVQDPPGILAHPSNNAISIPSVVGQLGGVSFLKDDRSIELIVQPTLLGIRWSLAESSTEYPLHVSMLEALEFLVVSIKSVLQWEAVKASITNITYQRFFDVPRGSFTETLHKLYVTDLTVPAIEADGQLNELNICWRTAKNVDLRFQSAYNETEFQGTSENGYLVIYSGGVWAPFGDAVSGARIVHDELYRFFKRTLTEEVNSETGESND